MKVLSAVLRALLILAWLSSMARAMPPITDEASQVLLPGTKIVIGYPDQGDFYVVSDKNMPRLIAELHRKKELDEAKILAVEHLKLHASIRLNADIITALNDSLKNVRLQQPSPESRLTIVKGRESIKDKFKPIQLAHHPQELVCKTAKQTRHVLSKPNAVSHNKVKPKLSKHVEARLPKKTRKALGHHKAFHATLTPVRQANKAVKKAISRKQPKVMKFVIKQVAFDSGQKLKVISGLQQHVLR